MVVNEAITVWSVITTMAACDHQSNSGVFVLITKTQDGMKVRVMDLLLETGVNSRVQDESWEPSHEQLRNRSTTGNGHMRIRGQQGRVRSGASATIKQYIYSYSLSLSFVHRPSSFSTPPCVGKVNIGS